MSGDLVLQGWTWTFGTVFTAIWNMIVTNWMFSFIVLLSLVALCIRVVTSVRKE